MSTKTVQKPRWMPIHIEDDMAATQHLSAAQYGAYMRLCTCYWHNGPPPDHDGTLARIAGMTPKEWRNARPVIAPFFEVGGGQWISRVLDAEVEAAYLLKKKNKARTAAATEARRQKREAERLRKQQRYAERNDERRANVTLSQVNSKAPSPARAANVMAADDTSALPADDEDVYWPDDLEPRW